LAHAGRWVHHCLPNVHEVDCGGRLRARLRRRGSGLLAELCPPPPVGKPRPGRGGARASHTNNTDLRQSAFDRHRPRVVVRGGRVVRVQK